jgi:hypothetical protein
MSLPTRHIKTSSWKVTSGSFSIKLYNIVVLLKTSQRKVSKLRTSRKNEISFNDCSARSGAAIPRGAKDRVSVLAWTQGQLFEKRGVSEAGRHVAGGGHRAMETFANFESLVDVHWLVRKSVTFAFPVFLSLKLYQLLPTQSSAQTEPVEVHGRVLGSVLLASFSKNGPVTELIQF